MDDACTLMSDRKSGVYYVCTMLEPDKFIIRTVIPHFLYYDQVAI